MLEHIIVPLDGSNDSARGLAVGRAVAAAAGGIPITVVGYALPSWLPSLRAELHDAVAGTDDGAQVEVVTEVPTRPMGEALAAMAAERADALVVMSTHGRGRSEALVGSVASSLLRHSTRPVLLVGPDCETARFRPDGLVTVTIDGTRTSEAILDSAECWAQRFGSDVELVSVLDPTTDRAPHDGYETAALARLRREFRDPSVEVGFEVLHDARPAKAIVARAEDTKSAIVAMATHGAEGLARITTGSVTSAVTRHAPCPVLVVRPATADPHNPRSVMP